MHIKIATYPHKTLKHAKQHLFRSVLLTFLDRNLQPAVLVVHHGRYVGNYKQPQYRHQDRQPQTKVLAVNV